MLKGEKGEPRFETLEHPMWATGRREMEEKEEKGSTEYEFERLEVGKGTLVVLHGNLLHRSGRNRSGKGRMAYTFSLVDGNAEMPVDSYMRPDENEIDYL